MRRIFFILLLVPILACQDVIDVELPVGEPRLVIDAVIRINDTSQTTTRIRVKASQSSSFFDSITPAALQKISVTNTKNNTFIYLQETDFGTGVYEATWETAQLIDGELELNLNYEDQAFQAKTKFIPTVPIDSLRQGSSNLFGDDETEVLVRFTDNGERRDHYLFDFNFGEYLVTEDEFYQGQQFELSFFYDKDLKDQTELKISLIGVDKVFFNYMNQILQQSGSTSGPFSTPTTTVRGNIINISGQNNDNFALGYFAVCQTFSRTIVINKETASN
ncbi:DUF4249 family protein [Arenibacter certesii]|uniref:DUF4249 domain-containing protein n=1 Tax=Arenibacter certesii TaxID=228955 RepID=A0A918J4R8_9FLAO|nr:DUF4249 family protein [Arenibacter certesii]GGW42897.1 hypothetical protein GCM10007383_29320 [Arenibacter certesii]